MEIEELQEKAKEGRRWAIEACFAAQSGHPGSALSTMEMLVALYFGRAKSQSDRPASGGLRHDPRQPDDPARDYFLLSNGHACPGLYAVLALAGYFGTEELKELRQLGAGAQGHPHRGALPGIEISSGSLGQGLSVGLGLAEALQLEGADNQVVVMMSDGEQEEGSTWEAVMYGGKVQLSNLVAIVDKNQMQIDGSTEDVMPSLDPLAAKYEAFGWVVKEIDGHDLVAVTEALEWAKGHKGAAAIISNTVRGKGVSYMEGSEHWHAGAISEEEYEQAKVELSR